MGVFNRFMGSPDCEDLKNAMGEVNFFDQWPKLSLGLDVRHEIPILKVIY
jgi:hypothetical protein